MVWLSIGTDFLVGGREVNFTVYNEVGEIGLDGIVRSFEVRFKDYECFLKVTGSYDWIFEYRSGILLCTCFLFMFN